MISPWEDRYHRPRLQRRTREFRLPDGRAFSLTLEEADTPALGLIADQAQELIQRYLGTRLNPAPPVALPDGTVLRPSRVMCQSIAQLMVMQRPEKGAAWNGAERPFSFLDWVGVMSNWPQVWLEIQEFAGELIAPEEAEETTPDPNPPAETGTGAGSASA